MITIAIDLNSDAFDRVDVNSEIARIVEAVGIKISRDGSQMGKAGLFCYPDNGGKANITLTDSYFSMEFEMENAAFESNDEVIRVCGDAAQKIRDGRKDFKLHDHNGNHIGRVRKFGPESNLVDLKKPRIRPA